MNDRRRINQKLIVPLFNVELEESLQLTLTNEEFLERLTFFLFHKPIHMEEFKKKQEDNKPIPIPIPQPKAKIYLFPWDSQDSTNDDIRNLIPLEHLPSDFDVFDNLGPVAFRAGPGGLGGFQTITTAFTKRQAKALLIIEFEQIYPEQLKMLMGSINPYEANFIESLLDALRLFSGNEPHQYKGFHVNDHHFLDIVTKWPLTEIQGQPVKLVPSILENLKICFLQIWHIRRNNQDSKSCKIINLALEYYYLSSTMTELRTIYLYLMIAFEALFKAENEDSASAASSRMAKLLAETKAQAKEIRRFMWNKKDKPGCCEIRNQIVHGETTTLSSNMFWQLKKLMRIAILRTIHLVLSSKIDKNLYYESLGEYINIRFQQLPNN